MANNHIVFNGTHCSYWDVDALNLVGIAATDIDNGTFLTLTAMKLKDATGGYEFTVAAGQNADLIAGTPAQGYGLDAQLYDDPRYFTNEAGKPISVKRLVKGDCIEFTVGVFPAAPAANGYAKVQASGKLTAQAAADGADYQILATNNIDIGGELVKTWILMKLA